MTSELFASLKVSPSQIGYSEDTPSSLGDSANKSWDSRIERICMSLVFSVQQACRSFDKIYLLSKGYQVKESDWNYRTVSITHIEDLERSRMLTESVESLKSIIEMFNSLDTSINKNYLVQSMIGNALSGFGVDVTKLFTVDEVPQELNSKGIKGKSLERDWITSSVAKMLALKVIKDPINSENSENLEFNLDKQKLIRNSVDFNKMNNGIYPDDTKVEFDASSVVFIDSEMKSFKKNG